MGRPERDKDITGEVVAITDRLVEESRELLDELDERLAEMKTDGAAPEHRAAGPRGHQPPS